MQVDMFANPSAQAAETTWRTVIEDSSNSDGDEFIDAGFALPADLLAALGNDSSIASEYSIFSGGPMLSDTSESASRSAVAVSRPRKETIEASDGCWGLNANSVPFDPALAAAASTCSKGYFTIPPTARAPVKLRNVYIAGLPLQFAQTDLLDVLKPFGNVLSCRMFVSNDAVLNTGKAYGFGLYERPEEANAAVAAIDGMTLEGFRLAAQLSRVGSVRKTTREKSPVAQGTAAPLSNTATPYGATPNFSMTGTPAGNTLGLPPPYTASVMMRAGQPIASSTAMVPPAVPSSQVIQLPTQLLGQAGAGNGPTVIVLQMPAQHNQRDLHAQSHPPYQSIVLSMPPQQHVYPGGANTVPPPPVQQQSCMLYSSVPPPAPPPPYHQAHRSNPSGPASVPLPPPPSYLQHQQRQMQVACEYQKQRQGPPPAYQNLVNH